MRELVYTTTKKVVADRPLFLLLIGVIIGSLLYIAYVGINIASSDLQLAIRYTSFGETHFYRDKWWYLLSFVGFGMLFLVAHVGLAAKLVAVDLKQLAYAFMWLSVVILMLMFAYTYSVLGIAYLN